MLTAHCVQTNSYEVTINGNGYEVTMNGFQVRKINEIRKLENH